MAASLQASEAGLALIDRARRKKGWNKKAAAWCNAAGAISPSTLDRFWARKPISQEYFVAICAAVDLQDWEAVADLSPLLPSEIVREVRQQSPSLNDQHRQRLEQQRQDLQAEWNLRSEKVQALRRAYVIESGAGAKFQLQKQIEVESAELEKLTVDLEKLEQRQHLKLQQQDFQGEKALSLSELRNKVKSLGDDPEQPSLEELSKLVREVRKSQ